MDQEKLRTLMLENKHFLNLLYKSNQLQARNELAGATNIQIRLLLSVLHCCANGAIPIPKEQFEAIQAARKLGFLEKNFFSKIAVNKLLRSPRKIQIQTLNKVSLYSRVFFMKYMVSKRNINKKF